MKVAASPTLTKTLGQSTDGWTTTTMASFRDSTFLVFSTAAAALGPCMAHTECARIVPETWVDDVVPDEPDASGEAPRESMVFGVDIIVKDRWNLVSVILFTAYIMVFQL